MAPTAPPCPICGNTEWEEGAKKLILRKIDPRIVRGGGTPAKAYFCTSCEFIRLHRAPDDPSSAGSAA